MVFPRRMRIPHALRGRVVADTLSAMTIETSYVVFPEGDTQEIPRRLSIDQIVDHNGLPLCLPLPTARMIAYRVVKIRHCEERGMHDILHYLELVPAFELTQYVE